MHSPAALIDHKDLLASAQEVEPLPVSVGRLAQLVSDPDAEIREIVEVISFDQSLTATLLRRANSAAVAGRRPIRSVHEAVVRLGPSALLSVAFSAAVGRRMSTALPAYGLAEGALWKHSVAAALAAEVLRAKAKAEIPAEVATAALLHDFGKIVLSSKFGPQVLGMLDTAARTDNVSLLEAEQAVFGVDHADIGGIVAQHWKLPPSIVDGIIQHHSLQDDLPPICGAVSIAHTMSHDVLQTDGLCDHLDTQTVAPSAHAGQMDRLGIDPASYPDLVTLARARFEELAERYGVV